MKIKLIISFLIIYPFVVYSQSFDKSFINFNSNSKIDPLYEFEMIDIENRPSDSIQKKHLKKLITLFFHKQYPLFFKESSFFLKKFPQTAFTNEIFWLEGYAYLLNNQLDSAKEKLLLLTKITNIELRDKALFQLSEISIQEKKLPQAMSYLERIYYCTNESTVKEVATIKLIKVAQAQNKTKASEKFLLEFEKKYPNSRYIDEIQYFLTLNQVMSGNTKKAEIYAKKLLNKKSSPQVQRLTAEISLFNKKYDDALEKFLPLTHTENRFQDEALYKSALIYKINKDFTNTYKNLTIISKYFKKSRYYDRALEELANINIILKNYDEALSYFLNRRGNSKDSRARTLLKIVEIYFLKGDSKTTLRTANRIQRDFPYSIYANEALYWVGRTYLLNKDFEKSIQYFDRYLIQEPETSKRDEILIFLGHAYANLGNNAKARYYFQQILQFSKNEQLQRQALLGLGRSYNQKELVRSLEHFDKIWNQWPSSEEAHQALYFSGATRYNLRKNKEAEKNLSALTNNFPNSRFYDDAVLALAKLEFKAENFTSILDLENITPDSKNKEVISELKELQARSFLRTGDSTNALINFEEALRNTDNTERKTELILAYASALRNMGRYSEAVKQYEQYFNTLKDNTVLDPAKELILSEIAISYTEAGELSKAEKMAEYIANHFPKSRYLTDIYFKLADDQLIKNNYSKAVVYYKKAQAITDDPDILIEAELREVWALSKAKMPQAQERLEQFLHNYPKHPNISSILIRLADIYEKDNLAKSIKLRKQLIKEYPTSIEAEQARIYFTTNIKNTSSIEELEKEIAQTKDIGLKLKYLYQLGLKLENEGEFDKAVKIFQEIHKNKDQTHGADSAFRAGRILSKQEKYEESLKLYINIIAQYEEEYYAQALDLIIETYFQLNDTKNAEKFKQRLLEKYPESPESKKWKS